MTLALDQLFVGSRLPDGVHLLVVVFYFPIGILLAVIRFFISLHTLLVASILPKSFFLRRWVLRVMCTVLGIFVAKKEDCRDNPGTQPTLLVSNHTSLFDHLAADLIIPNYVLTTKKIDSLLSWLYGYHTPQCEDGQQPLKQSIQEYCEGHEVSLLVFPEESTTNSGRGMLKFAEWAFDLGLPVQPMAITVHRPLIGVAVSTLDSSVWSDAFWHLFSPITIYSVRLLPELMREESETLPEFTRRVQALIGQSAGLQVTKHNAADKADLVKRLPLDRRLQPDDRLSVMVRQVKEVLPDVPASVIGKDLKSTNDVDITITNLLEGKTPYSPETTTASLPSKPAVSLPPAPLPAAFSRSPQDRQLSLAERKQQLMDNARQRYIDRHGPPET